MPQTGTALTTALEPWSTGTALLNWLGAAGPEEVARAWTPETYERLRAVKRRVDPGDMFRFGHRVPA